MQSLVTLNLRRNKLTELSDDFDQLFPKLDELLLGRPNDLQMIFNCTYLWQFLRTLRFRSHAVDVNGGYDLRPNIGGINCEEVKATALASAAPQTKRIGPGFQNAYNVWLRNVLVLIGVANLAICGAIVVIGRRIANTSTA